MYYYHKNIRMFYQIVSFYITLYILYTIPVDLFQRSLTE